ncbi:putative integral membrane protein [Babesia bovis T2Bo]|uniref:PH domain-containing protein n=1 Tax=Babesia bovis TaxID=5865 RepID=A7AT51_BABBO|nr:putative integral membrane protein [Babesia bovis T2Bo]EDO06112.1 putative integral membrane protein [Babesia bovis T2Bo]|eukprot:XP_001609680.1 hypothetical protein [Babesia bovis T2Bo]
MDAHYTAAGDRTPESHSLPPQCRFTMQQWLFRRTSHTRRYKRCYIVLHNDRLYSFRKPPKCRKCDPENLSLTLRYATASWMIAGAEFKADTQGPRRFYEWKLVVKPPKIYIGDKGPDFSNFKNKAPLSGDNINDIFRDIDADNRVGRSTAKLYTDDSVLWLATSNYKVAADWTLAVLCTVKYGSLRNFVNQNSIRSKHLAWRLPFYLWHLEFFPKSHNMETTPRRKAAFTFMKLSIMQLLHVPLPDGVSLSCIVEHNSSFYVLNLPLPTQGGEPEIHRTWSNVSGDEELHGQENQRNSARDRSPDLCSDQLVLQREYLKRQANLTPGAVENMEEDKQKVKQNNATNTVPHGQGYNMLSKLWGLNKGSEKRKVIIRKRSFTYGEDACIYLPMYQNFTHDYVWVHVVTSSDMYIGSAAITNCDFSVVEPSKPKTCILKHIEAVNPLNQKRLNLSDIPNPNSVINTSKVKAKVPQPGYIVLSIVTPKHYGNFMDPVKISHHSPQEYLGNATKASTSGGLHMLMTNIKRVVAAYRTIKTLGGYVTRVLQFKSTTVSIFWIVYIILALGFYQDKLMLFVMMPLMFYSLMCNADYRKSITGILLKYPLLVAILPQRITLKFLLLPKPVCAICTKRKAFLNQNSHVVNEVVNARILVTRKVYIKDRDIRNRSSSYCVDGMIGKEHAVTIEHRDHPMLTPNQAMNPYVSYISHPGTQVESCNHKGIVHSYLAGLFLNHIAPNSLDNIKPADGHSVLKAMHSIYYYPPPYPWGVVPWLQNVIFTLKYIMMTLFITLAGGMGDIQTLHLLHRIRVCTKLNDEAVNPAEELQQRRPLRIMSITPPVEELSREWYENERKSVLGVYSKECLRFYDRPNMSSKDGRMVSIPPNIINKAKVLISEETDENGWMYAKNWTSVWYKEAHTFTFVRRRKWITKHRKISVMSARNTTPSTRRASPVKLDITNNLMGEINHSVERENVKMSSQLTRRTSNKGFFAKQEETDNNPSTSEVKQGDDIPRVTPTNDSTTIAKNNVSKKMNPLGSIRKGIISIAKTNNMKYNPNEPVSPPPENTDLKSRFKFPMINRFRTNVTINEHVDNDTKWERSISPQEVAKETLYQPAVEPLTLESESDDPWVNEEEDFEEIESPRRMYTMPNIVGTTLTQFVPTIVIHLIRLLYTMLSALIMFATTKKMDYTDNIVQDGLMPNFQNAVRGAKPPRCKLITKLGEKGFCKRKSKSFQIVPGQSIRIVNNPRKHRKSKQKASLILGHTKKTETDNIYTKPEDVEYENFSVIPEVKNTMHMEDVALDPVFIEESEESEVDDSYSESGEEEYKAFNSIQKEDADKGTTPKSEEEQTEKPKLSSVKDQIVTTENTNKRGRLYSYIKHIYVNKIRRRQSDVEEGDILPPDDSKQPSEYDGLESDVDMETEHKMTVIGMLRKARGQIVVGNYYINLFTMRYEKFLNLFSWQHPKVTQLVMIICITLAIANYFFGVGPLVLLYVVAYFKSGYIAGTWERTIRKNVERHIERCMSELDIYRPFWDLTNRQVVALARAVYAFCNIDITSAVIRESATRGELAEAITAKLIEQKFRKNWERRSWALHLFRHSPSQLDL